MRIADIYINIPIKSIAKSYSYIVPAALVCVDVGWRVLVPFGGRSVEGFVVKTYSEEGFSGDAELIKKLKPILSAVDEEAWFSPLMIEAAKWLADFYLCSVGEMMRLFMPGKSGVKIQLCYEAAKEADSNNMLLMVDAYKQVYQLLQQNGAMKLAALAKAVLENGSDIDEEQLKSILSGLIKHNLVKRVYEAAQRAKAVYESCLYLPVPIQAADIEALGKRKKAQAKLAEWLAAQQEHRQSYTFSTLLEAGFSAQLIKALVQSGIGEIHKERVLRDSYKEMSGDSRIFALTEAQKNAADSINVKLTEHSFKIYLLYGVTGSGKTQVYIEAARRARALKRNVIVLVPEIALTGQLVQAFKSYFAQDIIVMHSRLSLNERNDAIMRVRTGETGIVIGARSALFTPLDNIGLIIMDEEQDSSYKQDESPRYHAKVVAKKLAELHEAVLLLGSATPSLESYAHALKGDYGLLSMPERVGERPLPLVRSADMRQELKMGRRSVISQPLEALIAATLAKKEQLILMLNRRGFSTFVMCRSCGEAIKCPKCTMPLVYHRDGRLLCHHCDIQLPVPDVCPNCHSHYIKYFGSGTEKLEQELAKLVPQARIVRMDRDTTVKKFAHTEILDKFKRGEYDILLGTQMVAKGHDIPNVTAVGILSADSTLNLPDFRAAERVFMLITQTAGRAGRGEHPGRVVVQCYNPEHFAVKYGMAQDYDGFFREEMQLRKALFNPPYSRIIKLIFQHKIEKKARELAEAMKLDFDSYFAGSQQYQAIGPAPAMMSCLNGIYRFSLLLKSADINSVLQFLRAHNVQSDMNIILDIDPLTTS